MAFAGSTATAVPAARCAALEALLQHPSIWRGGHCAFEAAALPTGFAALDALLPGNGWPAEALTEILLAREGIGEMRLALPALARLQAQGRDVVWIDPPYLPYAPALAAAGLDLSRLLLVRCRERQQAAWAFEQALRAAECGAAFAWLSIDDERLARRLQLAAREGGTWGVLWRRPGDRRCASAVPLRLGLASRDGRLAVHVLKRRGAPVEQPALIDVDARWRLPSASPRTPADDRPIVPRLPAPRADAQRFAPRNANPAAASGG